MVAMLWADRLARLQMPQDEVVEVVSRVIYMANWRPPARTWEAVSDDVREWVRRQARAAVDAVDGLARRRK
jgi:hypothetical protein